VELTVQNRNEEFIHMEIFILNMMCVVGFHLRIMTRCNNREHIREHRQEQLKRMLAKYVTIIFPSFVEEKVKGDNHGGSGFLLYWGCTNVNVAQLVPIM